MPQTIAQSSGGIETVGHPIQAYMRLASIHKDTAISVRKGGNGATVVGTRGRLQQFIVTILSKLGLSGKDRQVFRHFREALGSTYGHGPARDALTRAGIREGGPSLTAPGVRKALEFAVSFRRQAAREQTSQYVDLITKKSDKITQMTGLDPRTLGPAAISYFRYHFGNALGAFRGDASNNPEEVDKLAADFLIRAAEMEKAGLAGIAVKHAEQAEKAAADLVGAVTKSDATMVLKQAIELDYQLNSVAKIEAKIDFAASDKSKGMLKEHIGSVSAVDRLLTGAVRALTRPAMEDAHRHAGFLLRAIGALKPDGVKVIGLKDVESMLHAVIKPLERLGVKTRPLSSDLKAKNGLSNYAALLGAVAAFGGRPESVAGHREFSKEVGRQLDDFVRGSNDFKRVPFMMSPLFRGLFKPKNEQEVVYSLNILKKYFDLRIISAGPALAAPANVLARIGKKKMEMAREEVDSSGGWADRPSVKFVAEKQQEIQQARRDWGEAVQPLEVIRRKFVELMKMMEGHESALAQAGGSSLRQMMSIYPWQNANAPAASTNDTYGVLTMPVEFKMVADKDVPLGVTWRVSSSALKAEYHQFRTEELREMVDDFLSKKSLKEIEDEEGPFKVTEQFMADVRRQKIRLVDGNSLISSRIIGRGSKDNNTLAKEVRRYVGNDGDLLRLTSLMNQAIVAGRTALYKKGFVLPALISNDLVKGTIAIPTQQGEGTIFTLNKLDKDNYVLSWESDLDLYSVNADTGLEQGNGELLFNRDKGLGGVTGREEILLTRKDGELEISLSAERVEITSPPPHERD